MKKKLWILVFFSVLIWSGYHPKDQFTWFLEVLPALLGAGVLALTRKRFQFSNFIYGLILVHCLILMVGGKYTYAEVPLFDWLKEVMGWSRNNYDKVGHFAQGFVPALVLREMLLCQGVIASTKWRNVLIVSFCLAVSAVYEFIEWWVAVLSGEDADAFLGTQGYVWDTQSDMLLATIGAILALVLFSKIHDKALAKKPSPPATLA